MICSIAVSLASSHEDIIDIDISPGPVNNQTIMKCNFNNSSQGNLIRLKFSIEERFEEFLFLLNKHY